MTTNTRLLRPIPRLLCALTVAGLAYLFFPHGVDHHTVTRFIVAWNAAALTYIALTLWMIFALPLTSSNRRLASRLTRVAGRNRRVRIAFMRTVVLDALTFFE